MIVGFPGETEEDLAELEAFLAEAELDAVGVFGYSDEDGTEALGLPDKVDPTEIAARVERITQLAEHVAEDRAARRVGTTVEVLVERFDADDECWVGRAPHQGPDVDGECRLEGDPELLDGLAPGVVVRGPVTDAEGIDLVVEAQAVVTDGADAPGTELASDPATGAPVGAGAW